MASLTVDDRCKMIFPSRWYRAESRRRKAGSGEVLAVVALLALAAPAAAQPAPEAETAEPAATDVWKGRLSIGANLSFGNASWYFVNTGWEIARVDATTELSLSGDFTYGEASDRQGARFINRRSWVLAAAFDLFHRSVISPFAFASVEHVLPAGIDRRSIAGGGAKLSFIPQTDSTRLDFSTALIAVRTTPRSDEPPDDAARWSFRFRAMAPLESAPVQLSTRVYFQPRVADWGSYLLTLYASLGVELNKDLTVDLTFFHRHDTEALDRGARSNNDGRFSVGLTTRF